MPITFAVNEEHRLLEIKFEGSVTRDEILAHWKTVDADARELAAYDAVIDCTTARIDLTADEVRELAHYVRDQDYAPSRRALVSPKPSTYGMARMFQMLADTGPREYSVFRKMDDALEWLSRREATH